MTAQLMSCSGCCPAHASASEVWYEHRVLFAGRAARMSKVHTTHSGEFAAYVWLLQQVLLYAATVAYDVAVPAIVRMQSLL